MVTYVLFGVKAESLAEARHQVEKTLQVALEEREGWHAGGVHYTFGFPSIFVDVKNNLDLDDAELEFGGLSEPDFSQYPYLLYLNDAQKNLGFLAALEGAFDRFEKLRTTRV